MLDLHCHLLPAIDDGAPDMAAALQMARMAWRDGIRTVACTPHIYPGMYDNDAQRVEQGLVALRERLREEGIDLELVIGADVHLDPGVLPGLRAGRIPTLAQSRYVLLEPPHHVAPPGFDAHVFELMVAGYIPVITHPERLRWIEDQYETFGRLAAQGALMQVTAGALTGRFGRRPQYWAQRMLDDGLVHLLATDAHHPQRRPPLLAEGREAAALRVGEHEATHLVVTRPQVIVRNGEPHTMPAVANAGVHAFRHSTGWRTWFSRRAG